MSSRSFRVYPEKLKFKGIPIAYITVLVAERPKTPWGCSVIFHMTDGQCLAAGAAELAQPKESKKP